MSGFEDFVEPPRPRMTIFYHPDCAKHQVPEDHPEVPQRVEVTLGLLQERTPFPVVLAPLGTREHITLFHSEEYFERLNQYFRTVELDAQQNGVAQMLYIDSDTCVSQFTEAAALRAVGSVIAAVDDIYQGGRPGRGVVSASSYPYKSSFCCVRPPGHHAEPNRACGFCFFNNAGIAAKYAQRAYGVGKVAVLDFDVHHGNGTEEGFKDDSTLFYGSTHEEDNFPGTGPEPVFVGDDMRTLPVHRRIVNRKTRSGILSKRDFNTKWEQIMDEMQLFAPDLVIVSAGFDAHGKDPVGNSYLTEEDFKWATEIIFRTLHKVDSSNSIPVISVLEGGYDLQALSESALVHVLALERGYECCNDVNYRSGRLSTSGLGLDDSIGGDGDEVAAMARYIESLGLDASLKAGSEFANVFEEKFSILEDDLSEERDEVKNGNLENDAHSGPVEWSPSEQNILGDLVENSPEPMQSNDAM